MTRIQSNPFQGTITEREFISVIRVDRCEERIFVVKNKQLKILVRPENTLKEQGREEPYPTIEKGWVPTMVRPDIEFNLDFGTKPTNGKLELIEVQVQPEVMLKDFGKAYASELHRRNPLRADAVNLTEEELTEYFKQILILRVQYIYDNCKLWRQIKQLNIPTWIQYVITQIGQFIDYDFGLKVMPKLDGEIDLNFLLDVSRRLEAFKSDGVTMHKDAFPRSKDGDKDVMSMALIEGFVYSRTKDAHPITSYVNAFLGMKLVEEQTFKILYRVRYDDIDFIRSMLMIEESLI